MIIELKSIIFIFGLLFILIFEVNAQNQPPVAVNDTVTVLYNTQTYIYVRENDSIPGLENIKIDTVFYSGDANISFNSLRVSYTGATELIRKDSFQYVLRNTVETIMYDTAWVFINVRQKHYDFLDINNIKAHLGKDGDLFLDKQKNKPGFEVPAGSNNHSIFSFNPWLVGFVDASLKMNALRFGGFSSDYPIAGPIMDEQWYNEYDEKWDRLWKVNRSDIEYHIDHWADANYQPIEVIANWPAHGDTEKGQAYYLAPFIDYNSDGIYNPMDGDYPEMRGDQTIFLIYNFVRPNVLRSQDDDSPDLDLLLEEISITEVHGLFYAFDCEVDSALEHTVFANIKVINRTNQTYTDTYLGLWADLDVGNSIDDYLECDVNRNSFFAYNGDDLDESSNSGSGYGTNLVAQSVTLLKGIKMDDDGVDNDFGIEKNQSVNGLNFGDGIADNEYWGMSHFMFEYYTTWPWGVPTV